MRKSKGKDDIMGSKLFFFFIEILNFNWETSIDGLDEMNGARIG